MGRGSRAQLAAPASLWDLEGRHLRGRVTGSIWGSGAGPGALSVPQGLVSSSDSSCIWGRAGGTHRRLGCCPVERLLTSQAQGLWILHSHPWTQAPT